MMAAANGLSQPLSLEVKMELTQRLEGRVKFLDLHPTKPWILTSFYSGKVDIWNSETGAKVTSFEVTDTPVGSAKFIARKRWVVAGCDSASIYVYNYKKKSDVYNFKAHAAAIRCVAVHPTLPYVLSSSDDMLIRLWDWGEGWKCKYKLGGHSHSVMQVTFNPEDTDTFASASLDRTIKIWKLDAPVPTLTLDLKGGVTCVDYFTGVDKPYLIAVCDDHTAKVWDYKSESCVQSLEGHTHGVSAVCFHPELNIILTGYEDGTVFIRHVSNYGRIEKTLRYGRNRVCAIGYMKGSERVVIVYDQVIVVVKIGREEPIASMDNKAKRIKSVGADYEEEHLIYEEVKKLKAAEKVVERLGKAVEDQSTEHASQLEKYVRGIETIQSELSAARENISKLQKELAEARHRNKVLGLHLEHTRDEFLNLTRQLPNVSKDSEGEIEVTKEGR